jgi:hypothetical protein
MIHVVYYQSLVIARHAYERQKVYPVRLSAEGVRFDILRDFSDVAANDRKQKAMKKIISLVC